ncbi:GIY-YIG nuclease family protein [Steroidobacter sp.]|uniref:GIY-YIG nuclease family protein n=1 Tax=Steroidobacter sp. TaxID=1978227 RepID=UPI0039C9E7D0
MTAHKGYVYILSHPCMPGLLKIGSTDRPPERRARELSCGSAIPGAFVVEFEVFCTNPKEVEQAVHARLEADREHPKREFFRTKLGVAIDAVRSASKMLSTPTASVAPAAPSSRISVDVEFSYEFIEEISRAPRLSRGKTLRLQAILKLRHKGNRRTRCEASYRPAPSTRRR